MSKKIVAIIAPSLGYVAMMEDMGYKVLPINSVEDTLACANADLVLFTGGADVDPALYGHTMHPTTGISKYCDELYLAAYKVAKVYDKPCVGICRGSQFLCVMAGGTLVQDCDKHAVYGGHEVRTWLGDKYHVTSTHHQMQHPIGTKFHLLAWADDLTTYKHQHIDGQIVNVEAVVDYEVVYYIDTKSLAFQGHPETGNKSCLELFKLCMKTTIEPLL